MTALLDQPITAIAKAVKDGETTAVALAEAALARIEAVNPVLNAVVALNPELSLKYAAKADTARGRVAWSSARCPNDHQGQPRYL